MPWLLSKKAYQQLRQNATVLEKDAYGEKVLLKDQKVIKLFRTKRWLSSAMIYPYSMRFAHNAKGLKKRQIPTIEVERQFYCYTIRRHGVIYPLLKGTPLSDLLTEDDPEIYQKLAQFIAKLHDLGIYFRSLHPGNILLLPNGKFGLIDIADMQFKTSLSLFQRQRNFNHLFRYKEYHDGFETFGWRKFFKIYCQYSSKKDLRSKKLMRDLQKNGLLK